MSHDETKALLVTLSFTIDLISRGSDADRHRVALAYQEAQMHIATIPPDNGNVRSRILACFERFDALRAANDIACAGWMLTAINERANERNLDGWEILKAAADKAVELLPSPHGTIHWERQADLALTHLDYITGGFRLSTALWERVRLQPEFSL